MSLGTGLVSMVGYANPGQNFGAQKSLPVTTRGFGGVPNFVTFEEIHSDTLEITDHPIEQGASITDHAFKRPAKVTIKIGWSNSSVGGSSGSNSIGTSGAQVAEIYQGLLALQAEREPFEVMTGKRLYDNMLLEDLQATTDPKTENVLMVTAVFKEVIRVTTSAVLVERVPAAAQADPSSTQATNSTGNKALVTATSVHRASAEESLNLR